MICLYGEVCEKDAVAEGATYTHPRVWRRARGYLHPSMLKGQIVSNYESRTTRTQLSPERAWVRVVLQIVSNYESRTTRTHALSGESCGTKAIHASQGVKPLANQNRRIYYSSVPSYARKRF